MDKIKHCWVLVLFTLMCTAKLSAQQKVYFTVSDTCAQNIVEFRGQTTIPADSILEWKWDFTGSGKFVTGLQDENILMSKDTTITIGLKVISTFGSDSTYRPVTIAPLPIPNFIHDNLCAGLPATFINISTIKSGRIFQCKWDYNDDGSYNAVGDTVMENYGPVGNYLTKLTCVSDKGCEASVVLPTDVFPNPTANFNYKGQCLGDSTLLINLTTITGDNIEFYKWIYGDGTLSPDFGNSAHIYKSAGNFKVTLIVTSNNNCHDTIARSFPIYPRPEVDLSFSGDTVFFKGAQIEITANASGGTGQYSYSWSNGSNAPTINVTDSGKYIVIVDDGNKCTASSSTTVKVKDLSDISIGADIITPNGDGFNDYFKIEDVEAYSNCTFTVYNIWNVEVYSTTGYKNDWGGTYNGKPLPSGAYFYVIQCSGQTKPIKGTINILR